MDFFAIVLLGFIAFTLSALVLCIRWRLKSTWAMTLGSVLIWGGVLVFAFGPRIETTGQSYNDSGVVNSSFRTVGPHPASHYLLGGGGLLYIGGLLLFAATAPVGSKGGLPSTKT